MSQTALIILAAGKDRPGIVDRISGLVYEAGCNLEDSRMCILGGEFSLMVLITGPSASLERVVAGLPRLERELDLLVKVKETLAGAGVRPGVTS
ncbi:MAG TPA: ACT domain-containing protein, partial [Planctomycetota bacterium]|nr:ACT domain-containing protein [Planctomycetota bacterium]